MILQGLLISLKHNVDTLLRNVSKTTDITATNNSVRSSAVAYLFGTTNEVIF